MVVTVLLSALFNGITLRHRLLKRLPLHRLRRFKQELILHRVTLPNRSRVLRFQIKRIPRGVNNV